LLVFARISSVSSDAVRLSAAGWAPSGAPAIATAAETTASPLRDTNGIGARSSSVGRRKR